MTLPDTTEPLERRVVTLWRLAALVRVAMFGGVAASIGLPAAFGTRLPPIAWVVLAGAALFGLPALVAFATAGVRWRRFRFGVSDAFLRVRHGWLSHHEKVIPISRVQHLDVDEGFFERLFGLATLEVFTAGGRRATFRIPGLTPVRARALRRTILAASEGDEALDDPDPSSATPASHAGPEASPGPPAAEVQGHDWRPAPPPSPDDDRGGTR